MKTKRDIEFEVTDSVYFNISPIKGLMRFFKKGKLSSWYVVPYKNFKCIGKVAYELDFPNDLYQFHPVFNVSILKNFIWYPISTISLEGFGVGESL